MSMFNAVFGGLRALSLAQLLFAFVGCAAYALAQGGLLERRGRRIAWLFGVAGVAGFMSQSPDWTGATMLVAFAVATIGVFAAVAWVTSRLLGLGAQTTSPTGPMPLAPQSAAAARGAASSERVPPARAVG